MSTGRTKNNMFFEVFLREDGRISTLLSGQTSQFSRKKSRVLVRIPKNIFKSPRSTFYGYSDRSLKHYISKYYRGLMNTITGDRKKIIGGTHYNHFEIVNPNYFTHELISIISENTRACYDFVQDLNGSNRYPVCMF